MDHRRGSAVAENRILAAADFVRDASNDGPEVDEMEGDWAYR